jgi:polysaccharide export outer membrane protein
MADDAPPPFVLGREDVVEVSVYRDPELSRTVPVRPDGHVSLPIVGELAVAGLTPEQVRAEVTKRLQAFVQEPAVVSVIVREVNSARFFVLGEVAKPGAYPLRGEVGVLQALAVAGGPGEFSSRKEVVLVRSVSGRRFTIDMDALESGTVRLSLHPGDTVVVR